MSTAAAELIAKARTMRPEELQEVRAEIERLAAETPAPAQPCEKKAPLWDIDELRAWKRKVWGDRFFTAEEVQEMRDAEDGVTD